MNQRKHGVAFREALSIFNDPYILSKLDELHSIMEDRWISLGVSELERLLIVVHTECDIDDDTEVIRLISARRVRRTLGSDPQPNSSTRIGGRYHGFFQARFN